jgi:hypothetical protein
VLVELFTDEGAGTKVVRSTTKPERDGSSGAESDKEDEA